MSISQTLWNNGRVREVRVGCDLSCAIRRVQERVDEWAGEDIGLTTKPRKLNESFPVLDNREADRVHYDEGYTEEIGVLQRHDRSALRCHTRAATSWKELKMTRRTCKKELEHGRKILRHTVMRRLNAPDCELVLLHLRMNNTDLSLAT